MMSGLMHDERVALSRDVHPMRWMRGPGRQRRQMCRRSSRGRLLKQWNVVNGEEGVGRMNVVASGIVEEESNVTN